MHGAGLKLQRWCSRVQGSSWCPVMPPLMQIATP